MITSKGKQPIFSFDCAIKEGDKEKQVRIQIRRPTRTISYDADMFYSIKLNEYIKMGLLTSDQLAKKQIDVGGTFSDEQQKKYAQLHALAAEKEDMLLRLLAKKPETLSENEDERKSVLMRDLAMIRTQLSDYEYIKNAAYEHTANAKARNDTILWWVLALTQYANVENESSELSFVNLFAGDTHESRKTKLEELEDEGNSVLAACFDKVVRIVTMWFWMGVTDEAKMKELVDDIESSESSTKP